MLKTVAVSSNKKTGPIAVTYRAGGRETYGTCPKTCGLIPDASAGADAIDREYLAAVLDSVPRNGIAWTYSHFPAADIPVAGPGQTVINASCDTVDQALAAVSIGRPAVLVSLAHDGVVVRDGVRFIRCPAELSEGFTCMQCGNGQPLCAQGKRDYVVVFVAHGTAKKKVGTGCGGCYAAQGPTAIQWHNTRKNGAADDAAALRAFAKSLPPGSMLRHHVAGDIGQSAR